MKKNILMILTAALLLNVNPAHAAADAAKAEGGAAVGAGYGDAMYASKKASRAMQTGWLFVAPFGVPLGSGQVLRFRPFSSGWGCR